MKCRVLLCDDEPTVGRDWVEIVRGVAPPKHYVVRDAPEAGDVRDAIHEVFARQVAGDSRERSDCLFDDVDILVLDYDLLNIDRVHARHTGESLARLVRIYSNVEVVVVVNQYVGAQFDLSLQGHPTSDADLNIDAGLLGVKGLWTDPPWDGFRPWHWQTLHRAVATQRARSKWIKGHFKKSIVSGLGMRSRDVDRLPDAAFGSLAANATNWTDLRKQTFGSFALGPGGAGGGEQVMERWRDGICRFLSSRIGKWLERYVLGPQDVLIDLPHLVQRYPFLLGDDVGDLEAWNAVVSDNGAGRFHLPDGSVFSVRGFLSRPAVWRLRLEADKRLQETRCAYDFSSVPSFVFLEDVSQFARLEEAKEFRAGYHNAFDRRFVKRISGISYAPQRRLAWAE